LVVATRWWAIGVPLAVIYVAMLFRLHRGKAVASDY
jgi:hypothetical protein